MLYGLQDGSFYLVDEGSANGSYINAVRISLPTRLNDGDQVSIRSMNMQFRQSEARANIIPSLRAKRPMTLVMQENIELIHIVIPVADIRALPACRRRQRYATPLNS